MTLLQRAWVLMLALGLGACTDDARDTAIAPPPTGVATPADPTPSTACADENGMAYVCGLVNAEDILPLGDTPWVLVSGMNGELGNDPSRNGTLHLVNRATREWQVLFPGNAPRFQWDQSLYGDCPGPLDAGNFSAHGLAVKALDTGPAQYRLYMTSHGAREAVEVFDIDVLLQPTIAWVGCIPMPATSWTNSVVILNDWGFFATQFMDPTGSGMQGVIDREITGHVFEWHPDGELGVLAGSELSGPNGIEISGDERYLFVAAFGTQEVVRFDRGSRPPDIERVDVGIAPDNLRWNERGTLYAAGGNVTPDCSGPVCGAGWSVWEVVPFSMQAARIGGVDASNGLPGVSVATQIGRELWIGTYSGDRIGIIAQP
ncbi:MAG TPA: hypothetical protein VNR18_12885 [Hyphomicrobiales bacterium]|nr:hypothetical protein [Hyphomicrobiales bacterium]